MILVLFQVSENGSYHQHFDKESADNARKQADDGIDIDSLIS